MKDFEAVAEKIVGIFSKDFPQYTMTIAQALSKAHAEGRIEGLEEAQRNEWESRLANSFCPGGCKRIDEHGSVEPCVHRKARERLAAIAAQKQKR